MRPTIVVDANPIISALIGGFSRGVFFNHNFNFITTEFTIKEVEKYLPYIAKKAKTSEKFIESFFHFLPLKVYSKDKYCESIEKAKLLITDEKDVDVLALALETNHPIWSNDPHFEGIKEVSLIKTKDFV
ncbi:MAG: PIN domain-containing protein [Candidatus Woesearchaeota archaeon]